MRQLLRRLWYAIRQRRFDADLAEELDFHRMMKRREFEDRGQASADAARATRRALGSVALAHDHVRDVWCPRCLQGVLQDFRLAVRTLAATRSVTTVAVLSLALGIGANTAIFSLVNSLLLRSLPVKDPERLALLTGGDPGTWSYPIWNEIRQRRQLVDAVAWSTTKFDLAAGGETAFVDGLWASGRFFETLGVPALLGRTLTDADDQRGGGSAGPVAVVSYTFWQRHFGGSLDTVGRTLTLDRVPFTIVGITPPEFFGADVGRTFDVVVPLGAEPVVRGKDSSLERRGLFWLELMVRLRPDQSIAAGTAALRGVQPQIRQATRPDNWPEALGGYLKEAFSLRPAATGQSFLRLRYQRPLLTLMVVVGLVLLIACANIANLLLARATARHHELSVRVALGASRWRLARPLLAESLLLAGAGAALGLVIAQWGSRVLVHQLSTQANAVFLDLSLDGHVLMFTIGAGVATALLFGAAPALRASDVTPMETMKEQRRGAVGDARGGLANGLVVAQVGLSVILVVAAVLFVRTFTSLAYAHAGFERDRVLVVTVNASRAAIGATERMRLYERSREAVRSLPGVAEAALSFITPASGMGSGNRVKVSGGTPLPNRRSGTAANYLSPGWFRTFGTPLMAGRDFTDRDRKDAPPVAIVNQAFVRKFLNGASPLGHTITVALDDGPTPGPPIDIVGMAADAEYGNLRDPVPATMYLPLAQHDEGFLLTSLSVSVRSAGGAPALLTKSVAAAIANVNAQLALTVIPLADQVNASLTQERILAMLSGFFGGLALLLAGLGLYGVTSYAVTIRRTELGIRMALGAAPRGIVRLVLSRVAMLVGAGLILGAVVSLWASKFVATLLYGLEPRDPVTLIGAIVVLGTVGALAAWLPAWRASRIDPASVLRES